MYIIRLFLLFRNDYTLEGVLTSCSIRWQDRTLNVVSYNIGMFIFAYILPLVIIIYCNIKIYLKVKEKILFFLQNMAFRYMPYQNEDQYTKRTKIHWVLEKKEINVWQKQFLLLLVRNSLFSSSDFD